MKQYLSNTLVGALLLSLVTAISAEEVILSKIELIIFSQGDESMLENLAELSHSARETLPPSVQLSSADTNRTSIGSIELTEDYELLNEYKKIQQDDELEVLHRIAWTQPQYERGESVYVSLLPNRQKSLLNGIARLSYKKLYLLELQFRYDSTSSTFVEQATPENKTIPIHMKKIVTDGKVYYLDHALIGVLMKISEIKLKSQAVNQ